MQWKNHAIRNKKVLFRLPQSRSLNKINNYLRQGFVAIEAGY